MSKIAGTGGGGKRRRTGNKLDRPGGGSFNAPPNPYGSGAPTTDSLDARRMWEAVNGESLPLSTAPRRKSQHGRGPATPELRAAGAGRFWRLSAQERLGLLHSYGYKLPDNVPAAQKNDMLLNASKAFVNDVSPEKFNAAWAASTGHVLDRPSVFDPVKGTMPHITLPKAKPEPLRRPPVNQPAATPSITDPFAGLTDPFANLPDYNYHATPYTGATYSPGAFHYGGQTPAQIQEQASKIVNGMLGTQRTDIQSLQKAAQDRAASRFGLLKGFGLAEANMLKQAGPATAATYKGAADQSAAYGKGFSDAYQHAAQGSQDAGNAQLAARGMNTFDNSAQTQAGGDAIFGLGGALPARTLQQQGAAFTAAANMLPGAALGAAKDQGIQALAGGEEEAAKYNAQLIDLARSKPGLLAQWMNTLGQSNLANRSEAAQEFQSKESARLAAAQQAYNQYADTQKLNADAYNTKYNAQVGMAQAKSSRDIALAQANVGLQEANINAIAKQVGTNAATAKTLSTLYGVDEQGNLTLAGRRALLADKKYQQSLKSGGRNGLSAWDMKKIQEHTTSDAEVGFAGQVKQNNDLSYTIQHEPMTYQDEFIHLTNLGTPPSLAQKIMNTMWTRPGYDRKATFNQDTGKFEFEWVKSKTGRPLKPYRFDARKAK